ncbi:MAG: 2'-5' RNA ligase family protein [Oscillospiraceae bacterium]|nr:2'-5' RNA ligase family protein [Oscillospiraceae bacterium]
MANYVAMVRFDAETDQKITCLQKKLKESGFQKAVSEWPPHITIAAYEGADEQALLHWSEEYAARQRSFKIGLLALSILPPGGNYTDTAVLCLNPSHSKTLVDFYYGFHEKYEDFCTGIGWYNSIRNGNPIMHSTIGTFNVATMQQALEMIFCAEIFREAEITALELYTYPMRLIKRFDLLSSN